MKIIVVSPMRTGSTWIHKLLVFLFRPACKDYVDGIDEVERIFASHASCVLKSHTLTASRLREIGSEVYSVRVLRNYKDSLISRALYCRYVRPAEGNPNSPEEDRGIQECKDMDDPAFLNVFLETCPAVGQWIDEILVFDSGNFDCTLYYEMLLHNPLDQLSSWLMSSGFAECAGDRTVEQALEECSFLRMRKAHTPGFIGSTGVGRWMEVLDPQVSRDLDRRYYERRNSAAGNNQTDGPPRKSEI
jgi:Sulfotransferase domain